MTQQDNRRQDNSRQRQAQSSHRSYRYSENGAEASASDAQRYSRANYGRTGSHGRSASQQRPYRPQRAVPTMDQDAVTTHEVSPHKSASSRAARNARQQSDQAVGGFRPASSLYSRNGSGRRESSSQGTRYSRGNVSYEAPRKRNHLGRDIAIIVGVLAAIAIGVGAYLYFKPINITINGIQAEISVDKTISAAMEKTGITVKPGNYIAVDGAVLTEGAGNTLDANVNGEATNDPKFRLKEGDVVDVTNGSDITEEYTSVETTLPYVVSVASGSGALHVFSCQGVDGVQSTRTGSVSGRTATVTAVEAQNPILEKFNAKTGGQKVIALTFDDGPSKYTQQVLDILAEYGIKATFFVIGNQTETETGKSLLQAEKAAGHQICTHSYDHAEGSGQGVNLGYMTADEQIQEVQKGRQAIANALGVDISEVSTVFRSPGGNFSDETARILQPYITAEIGWNVDTVDWSRPGATAISSALLTVSAGNIVLCHDGGGDRTQTIEALKTALPKLIENGFSFVTIDELIALNAANSAS